MPVPLTFAGVPLTVAGAPLALEQIYDSFEAHDRFPRRWIDVKDWEPDGYSRCGIVDGAIGVPDPFDRPGEPAEFEGGIGSTDHTVGPGEYAPGIGARCAITPWTDVEVEILYLGDETDVHEIEGAPAVHFTPGTESMCLGVWPSKIDFFGTEVGVMFLGTLGNPAEAFEVLATALYDHGPGAHLLAIRSVDNEATIRWDGVELDLVAYPSGTPIESLTVPAELQGSTLHGACVDIHLDPDPTRRVIDWVRIRPL